MKTFPLILISCLVTLNGISATTIVGGPTISGGGSGTGGAATNVSGGTFNNVTLTSSSINGVSVFGSGDVTAAGLAAGSYALPFSANTIYVATNGNNSTGDGSYNRPFLTISNAVRVARPGQTVHVASGNYTNELGLLKTNVNIHFESALVFNSTTVGNFPSAFDDANMLAGTTNRITGLARFYWSQGNGATGIYNTNDGGILLMTNPLSRVVFHFDEMDGESYVNDGNLPHLIRQDAGYLEMRWNKFACSKSGETLSGFANQLGGIFWVGGEFYYHGDVGSFPGYAIWAGFPENSPTNNMWGTSDLLTGYIYGDTTNTQFKSWYTFKEFRRDQYGAVADCFGFYGGRNYVTGQKMSCYPLSNGDVFHLTASTEVWADIQKIERTSWAGEGISIDDGSKFLGRVFEFTDTLAATNPVIVNAGSLDLNSSKYIGKAPFLNHAGVTGSVNTRLRGVYVDTSSGPQPALIIQDTNFTATGSYFKAASTTNTILAIGRGTNADVFPALPFASLEATNFVNFYFDSSDFTTLTNLRLPTLNMFTYEHATRSLIPNVAGWYSIDALLTFEADNVLGDNVGIAVFINDVQETNPGLELATALAASGTRVIVQHAVRWIPANSKVNLRAYGSGGLNHLVWSGSSLRIRHL